MRRVDRQQELEHLLLIHRFGDVSEFVDIEATRVPCTCRGGPYRRPTVRAASAHAAGGRAGAGRARAARGGRHGATAGAGGALGEAAVGGEVLDLAEATMADVMRVHCKNRVRQHRRIVRLFDSLGALQEEAAKQNNARHEVRARKKEKSPRGKILEGSSQHGRSQHRQVAARNAQPLQPTSHEPPTPARPVKHHGIPRSAPRQARRRHAWRRAAQPAMRSVAAAAAGPPAAAATAAPDNPKAAGLQPQPSLRLRCATQQAAVAGPPVRSRGRPGVFRRLKLRQESSFATVLPRNSAPGAFFRRARTSAT